jgi:hypothetical protein
LKKNNPELFSTGPHAQAGGSWHQAAAVGLDKGTVSLFRVQQALVLAAAGRLAPLVRGGAAAALTAAALEAGLQDRAAGAEVLNFKEAAQLAASGCKQLKSGAAASCPRSKSRARPAAGGEAGGRADGVSDLPPLAAAQPREQMLRKGETA